MSDFIDPSIGRNIGIALNRRNQVENSRVDVQSSIVHTSGKFLVGGAGEVIVPVKFPMTFIEDPLFSFGGALDLNQSLDAGYLPTISGVVVRWSTTARGPNSSYFVGADIAVVSTGAFDQKIWFHWHFVGTALINPISNSSSLTGQVI